MDQVAVVTGASQGLGFAIARAFAQEGARVMAVGRTSEALEPAMQALRDVSSHSDIVAMPLDVTAVDAGSRLATATRQHFGRWDVLVNCAGRFTRKNFLDLSEADWQDNLAIHLTAPFRLAQALIRANVASGRREGVIINIGSVHASIGEADAVAHCASKAGIVGLTRSMAEACRTYGIRVVAIAPGAIESQSADRSSLLPTDLVTQRDIAQIAIYLASERARFVTGTVIEAFGITRPVIADA